jgi:hypothetical protein
MPNPGFLREAEPVASVAHQIFPCLVYGNGAETCSHDTETDLIAVRKVGVIPEPRAASASLVAGQGGE